MAGLAPGRDRGQEEAGGGGRPHLDRGGERPGPRGHQEGQAQGAGDRMMAVLKNQGAFKNIKIKNPANG